MHEIHIIPSATRMYRASYEVICLDSIKRKKWEKALANGESLPPPASYIPLDEYTGGCKETGSHSTFYLFNLFPVTAPVNPEYAVSSTVQKLEGDSMINIVAWNELHYYSILGRVSVYKVSGDVIRFTARDRK